MSTRALHVPLSEVESVRIHCLHPDCHGILELPLENVQEKLRSGRCPFCHNQLLLPKNNPFELLTQALVSLGAHGKFMKVELVVGEENPA